MIIDSFGDFRYSDDILSHRNGKTAGINTKKYTINTILFGSKMSKYLITYSHCLFQPCVVKYFNILKNYTLIVIYEMEYKKMHYRINRFYLFIF